MNKSKIEWLRGADGKPGFSVNPVKGLCPQACSYCYARRMYRRYHWDETVRFDATGMYSNQYQLERAKPSRIFVGSTMELFGPWVKEEWLRDVFAWTQRFPKHTFIFLTKQPQNLAKWSPFPDNAWVGVSADTKLRFLTAMHHLADVKAGVKFVSFEPLLESMFTTQGITEHLTNGGIGWVIIGQQTPVSAKTQPKVEWVREIVQAADDAKIPVFLKNNLKGLLPFRQHYAADYHDKCYALRQEFPSGGGSR